MAEGDTASYATTLVQRLAIDGRSAQGSLARMTSSDRAGALLAAADALANEDMLMMAELMALSHASMRDDFAITVPAIDALVDIIKEIIGSRGGVRMTGGGFGGCVVALPPRSQGLIFSAFQALIAGKPAPTGY